LGDVGHQDRGITRAARTVNTLQAPTGDLLHLRDHLGHRESTARAQVKDAECCGFIIVQILKSAYMCRRQIGHVHVVAYRRTIGRGVVTAEHADRSIVQQGVKNGWNQVRFRVVALADLAIGVGAGGIEVPQADRAQPVHLGKPPDHALHQELAFPVRILGVGPHVFGDRDLIRMPVHPGTR